MGSLPDYTALLVTFNNEVDIPLVLHDLTRLNPPPRSTIIVDNASSDGTIHAVRATFPPVQLLPNPQNLGLSRAINQGFGWVEDEFVLLLNPDIRIPNPEFSLKLLTCILEDPQAAAVGPLQFKQLKSGPRLNFTWSYCTFRTFALFVSHLLNRRPRLPKSALPVTFLNFGCLLLKKAAFLSTGGMNESYFLYGEEPDLFLKLKRLNYTALLHPGAVAIHHRERSLTSVPLARRLILRIKGVLNLIHALSTGYFRLLLDKFSHSKSKPGYP
jgi:N-acetylglucosaminyl-diphospho-decaprenol L-rhamnosyltransferase